MEKFNKKFDFQIFKKPIKKNFLIINRFKRKLYKPAFYILLFQFLLIIFFLYDQRGRLNIRLQQFNDIIGLSIDSLNIQDYKNYISDSFRSLVSRKQITKVYLSLSFKDIQK